MNKVQKPSNPQCIDAYEIFCSDYVSESNNRGYKLILNIVSKPCLRSRRQILAYLLHSGFDI
jgi:hypothetical protein